MKTKNIDMLNGNLFKKILVFTIPLWISSILQLLFNACDLMVVGSFAGDDSLAAVGSTSSISALIVNLFIGVSVGANVVVARCIGSKDYQKCEKVVHTSILFSVLAGAFLMVIGLIGARYLLEALDTPADIIDKAVLYIQIYFGGMIFNMLYNFGSSILNAKGETKKPLYYLTIAGVLNVLLNLFFVIVLGMDVAGVAIATVASQAVSSILVIRYLIKSTDYVRLDIKKLKIDADSLKEIISIGLPSGINSCLFSISNVVIQKSVNSFGSIVVAGNSAAININSFIHTSMGAFCKACITFTGQNYGAGKLNNCKKVMWYCMGCAVCVGIILGGVAYLCANPLLGLYTEGTESILYGKTRLAIVGLTSFVCCIGDVFVSSLKGFGYSLVPMFMSILGVVGVRLIWIYTVFAANPTLETLYISYPISWLITALAQGLSFNIVYKKLKKALEHPAVVTNS